MKMAFHMRPLIHLWRWIMDITTMTFGVVLQATFNKSVAYFNRVGKTISAHFDTGVTYGVAAVFATGDATHINKLLPALVLAGLEPKFRRTVVAHGLVPFKYDNDACMFDGKIKKGLRATLEMADAKTGIPQWEIVLRAALDGELPENKSPAAWKLETRLAGLLKKAIEQGYTVKDIRLQFSRDMKGLVNKAETPDVQAVKSGQASEAADIEAAKIAA